MLVGIEFTGDHFQKDDDNNLLSELTANTIIICNNNQIMFKVANEVMDTMHGRAEHNNYCCEDDDTNVAKVVFSYGLQRVIDINGQRITFALEPAMIYRAKQLEDVWFLDEENGKFIVYPMSAFKGSCQTWEAGLDAVYAMVCGGRYGAYDGNWVQLDRNVNETSIS